MDILFLISIAIIFGFIAGKAAGLLKLPGVIGYLIAGLIFGPSFLNVFNLERLDNMNAFSGFALSIVAFVIGSEMKRSTLKDMGKGVGLIIVMESIAAFGLVTLGVYLLTGKLYLALVFGAMAPASAPTGTVAVLQECKARGRLTNVLYTVVGLDDGLAIIIFAIAVAMAKLIFLGQDLSFSTILSEPVYEIAGSIILGVVLGGITGYATQKMPIETDTLAVSLGAVLICAGIANYFHLSLILSNLSLGMMFVNSFPVANRRAYRSMQFISLPVYIVFFFIAGAHLQISLLPTMGVLGLVYIVCRIVGLTGGAFLGATLSKQNAVIRKYLGLGILSQAGVAIGLAILAAGEFSSLGQQGSQLAVAIVNTIAASTIVFEIIGPIATKFAICRAGEAGANITEEDLIKAYKVADVMDKKVPVISAGTSLSEVIGLVSGTDNYYYPVVNGGKELIGVITLDGIRKTFTTQELNDWLVALDIAEPVMTSLKSDIPLEEAFDIARHLDLEYLPITTAEKENELVGLLDCQAAHRLLSAEVLARQQNADKYR